jgi:hypothetical protein
MNIDLKNIKFFSTEEEREKREMQQISQDADYANPHSELAMMHNATQWGIYFFACITLLSTSALIYRVTYPHLAELVPANVAAISMLFVSFGASFAIEKMLRGNWEPFFKKLFVKGELDIVLLGLGAVFTAIILYGAITGMEIISEVGKSDPQIESITASAASINATIETNKKDIALLAAGKGKGIYTWQDKPTPHARKRIQELEAQNTAAFNSLSSLSKTTEAANAAKIETFTTKQAKAVHYLSILAIGAEILKFIIFIFWGYRSMQLNAFVPKPSKPAQEKPIPEKPKYEDKDQEDLAQIRKKYSPPMSPTPSTSKKQSDDPAATAYKNALNYRGVLVSRFREIHSAGGSKMADKLTNLETLWNDNEDRLMEACDVLGLGYPEPRYNPQGELIEA